MSMLLFDKLGHHCFIQPYFKNRVTFCGMNNRNSSSLIHLPVKNRKLDEIKKLSWKAYRGGLTQTLIRKHLFQLKISRLTYMGEFKNLNSHLFRFCLHASKIIYKRKRTFYIRYKRFFSIALNQLTPRNANQELNSIKLSLARQFELSWLRLMLTLVQSNYEFKENTRFVFMRKVKNNFFITLTGLNGYTIASSSISAGLAGNSVINTVKRRKYVVDWSILIFIRKLRSMKLSLSQLYLKIKYSANCKGLKRMARQLVYQCYKAKIRFRGILYQLRFTHNGCRRRKKRRV